MTSLEEGIHEIHTKCSNPFFREESSSWHCVGCGAPLDDDKVATIAAHQTAEAMKLLNGGEPGY